MSHELWCPAPALSDMSDPPAVLPGGDGHVQGAVVGEPAAQPCGLSRAWSWGVLARLLW